MQCAIALGNSLACCYGVTYGMTCMLYMDKNELLGVPTGSETLHNADYWHATQHIGKLAALSKMCCACTQNMR